MKVQDKKKIILAAMVVFLAGYWVVELFFVGGNHAPAPVAGTEAVKKGSRGPLDNMTIKVDVGLLSRPRPPYKAAKNIFRPVYTKPELVKPRGPAPGAAKPGEQVTVTPLPPLPPPPPPKPQSEIDAENAREEMKKIRVLGFLKRKGRTDVFVSLGSDNFVVAKGEKIIKEYYVSDIGKDFVLFADRNTGVEVRVSTEPPKGGSKTVPSPGVPGGGSSAGSPQPPFPGGAPGPGRMPGQGGPIPGGPRHFDPSQGIPGGVGAAPVLPQLVGQPEPLKNYSVR